MTDSIQPDVPTLLLQHRNCLANYRQLSTKWYGGMLAAEQKFSAGDSAITRSIESKRAVTRYALCKKDGTLTLIHAFESAHFVPIGNTPVRLTPVAATSSRSKLISRDYQDHVRAVESYGEDINTFIDDSGIKLLEGCKPDQRYRVTFYPQTTPQQIAAYFDSYQDLLNELGAWLSQQWNSEFQPLWRAYDNASNAEQLLLHAQSALKGFGDTLIGLWDSLVAVFKLITHPEENFEKLSKFLSQQQLDDLINASAQSLQTLYLIASDEPLLWAYFCTFQAWLQLLPPLLCTEIVTRLGSEVLIDILIGVFLTGGLGLAVKYTAKVLPTMTVTAKATHLLDSFIDLLLRTSKARSTQHALTSKPILLHADAPLNTGTKGKVDITRQPGDGPDQSLLDTTLMVRGKPQTYTEIVQVQHVDDVPAQSKNLNDQPAEPADKTCTQGCPVSMVTGEELLTLTDTVLDGVLPFEWTRLYRTSAVESQSSLGFGWSHSLNHRLQEDGDELLWTDHENRQTRFPRPTAQRPAITNSLARAAIYLGEKDGELILAQAGTTRRFYHFQDFKLIAISDAYGNRLTITHRDGRLHRIEDKFERALMLRYHNNRLCAVDYQYYDHSREFIERSDEHYAKYRVRLERWTTLHTPVSYSYNDAGQLIGATNALQETEHYRYDADHVIQERQLAGGATFYWEWQHRGKQARCIRHWNNFGQMHARYEWDDAGTVTVHHQDGSRQIYEHDSNARLVSQTDPDGATHQKIYDEQGRLIAEKDPLGAVTEYQYNESGLLTALIPPQDEPTYYSYLDGHVRKIRRGMAQWYYERNAQGDITRQTDPDGHITRYTYNPQGKITLIQHPDDSYHKLVWNTLGQLTGERLPDGSQRHYAYDAQGRKTTQQEPDGALTHYKWDAAGRLSQITLPGGKTRAWSYNAYGKVTAERDERGHITRYEYADHLHLVSRRINPDGSQLNYRYDNARLLLTGIENEHNEHYQLDYHPNGLLRQEIGFDGSKTAYTYDLNGHLLEKTEYPDTLSGDTPPLKTAYQRDSAGRLLVKTLPDGSEITYTYDSLGRLTEVDDGKWPLAYEYDLQDRLITEHQGWATLRYRYDALGQLSHCTLPDGNGLDYLYHPGGALKAINLNGQRLTGHRFEHGREIMRQQGSVLSEYHYDEQQRLKEHRVHPLDHNGEVSGHYHYRRTYQYDANSNLRLLTDSRKGQKSYAYDPLDRLTEVVGNANNVEHFAHDPAGNLLAQSYNGQGRSYGKIKGNRLLMQGDCHFDYDAYGNLLRERRGAGQRLVRHYRYDSQHRLIGITLPDGSDVAYRYDAFGRRIAKDMDGKTTQFLWQGDRLIAENIYQKGVKGWPLYRSYVYEPGTFKPMALLKGHGTTNEVYYYQLDHLGTPQELTDVSGKIVWSAYYRAYGNIVKFDINEISNPLRFQGQYYDEESGLHYNRHRYYNPNTGRYLTPDPIKLAGGLNSYQYVPNPTGWVDPLGLMSVEGDCPGEKGTPHKQLLEELAANGVKFTPENIVSMARNHKGQVVFLETGNSKAGLQHIIEMHGNQFAQMGVSERQIPNVVMKAVSEGKLVAYQGTGMGRPVYELTINRQRLRIAVTVGDNGFIVGANPRGSNK